MGMGVDDADQLQPQLVEPIEDQLMITARVHHDGLFCDGITDDGAVALHRADREGFTDQGGGLHG